MHCFLFPPQAPQLSPLVTWHHPWLPGVEKSPRQKANVLWGCDLFWNQTQSKQVWLEGSDKRNKQHFTKRVMSRTPELFPKYLNRHCAWNIFRTTALKKSKCYGILCRFHTSCQHFASGKMLIFKVSLLWMQAKLNLRSLELSLWDQLVGIYDMFVYSCPKMYPRDEVRWGATFHGLDRSCVYVRPDIGRFRRLRNCLTCDGTARDGHRWPQNESKGSKQI